MPLWNLQKILTFLQTLMTPIMIVTTAQNLSKQKINDYVKYLLYKKNRVGWLRPPTVIPTLPINKYIFQCNIKYNYVFINFV